MKDKTIVYIRITSMLFIIICHLGTYFGYKSSVGAFFSIGVPIFLFMSGFLYGKRQLINWLEWSKKRYVLLTLPIMCWLCILALTGKMIGTEIPSLVTWLLAITNLEGADAVIKSANFVHLTAGLGHLWFLTAIMICYATMPILQLIHPWVYQQKTGVLVTLLIGVILINSICNYYLGLNLSHIITFSIGYYWSKAYKPSSLKLSAFWFFLAFMCCIIRLGGKLMWSESVVYTYIIANIVHTLLAISIFNILYTLYSCIIVRLKNFTSKIRGIQYVDKLTYYIYITHYIFLTGAFNVRQYAEDSITMQLLLFSGLTIGSAILLERLSYYPIKWLTRKKS